MTKREGYSLVELLVVVAIVAILAAILFPVFLTVKNKAQSAWCMSNQRQVLAAGLLYYGDYDERVVLTGYGVNRGLQVEGRTWVQLLLPYIRDFRVFECPGDYGFKPPSESTFDEDLIAGDTYAKFYRASLRSNPGFNYLFLSPIVLVNGQGWFAVPRSLAEIASSAGTLAFVDSVYDRDESGRPQGGGAMLVMPPCRYVMRSGNKVDAPMPPGYSNAALYRMSEGWDWDNLLSPRLYGGAWPWHAQRFNAAFMDGAVRSVPLGKLTAGCDVRPRWQGYITDESAYIWDLN